MNVVIDASAAFHTLLGQSIDATITKSTERLAPELIVAELFNARWKVGTSGAFVPSIDVVLDFLSRVQLMPAVPLAGEAAELADELNHPVYDCFYVALARQRRAKLATLDKRLIRKLTSSGFGDLLA